MGARPSPHWGALERLARWGLGVEGPELSLFIQGDLVRLTLVVGHFVALGQHPLDAGIGLESNTCSGEEGQHE